MVWFFFFKQKTSYEMRISDWSSDVCSSDLCQSGFRVGRVFRNGHIVKPDQRAFLWDHVFDLDAVFGFLGARSGLEDRSEERRVGKECVSTCRSRWSPYH